MMQILSEKAWRSTWPEDVVESTEASLPEVPWKGQVARYRRLFQCMAGVEGASCSVSELSDLTRRMQEWSQRHAAYFSWPALMEGWSRAVWATLEEPQGKEDMAWLLAGYGPSVRLALKKKPPAQSWASTLLGIVNPAAEVASPEKVVEQGVERPAPMPRKSAVRERVMDPEVQATAAWLTQLIASLQTSSQPRGLQMEELDREIKEKVEKEGRPGPNRHAGWLEYRLLPAALELDAPSIAALSRLWPRQHSRSFIDPERTISRRAFWAMLDGVEAEKRAVVFESFLPTIIDTSEWTPALRYKMAVSMFQWTQAKPEAFVERLGLWKAWGGRLEDADVPPPVEGGVFSKAQAPSETVEQWITSKHIPAWTHAIIDRPSPRSPSMP